ncbi:MAG TPA: 23S rRNA (pseudouridine(1915)-N(3))-methyltransferase RlmH [Polyangia bacterium]|jgi:23S rRNA (pseudouridine1915-N3)-methyltransferase|nr:23S rRNA (pseudouridine(1915)-N(3))-methyltransferase RlmH [Polyangia bacterium]
MKLVVVAVGKMRDRHMAALCEDYVQRARRHLPVEIVEVEDDDALARRLPTRGELIALEPGGDAWTTDQLAKHVEHQMVHGTQAIVFLIGGALGLPADIVKKASRRLSLSNLTLPHRLARVVLCEQLYRAMSIIRGEPYHH